MIKMQYKTSYAKSEGFIISFLLSVYSLKRAAFVKKKKKKYVCNCHGYVQYTVCNKICACIKMLPEEKCIHFKFKV